MQQAECHAALFNNDGNRGRGNVQSQCGYWNAPWGTVRHVVLEMTISNSVAVDVSRWVLAIITTITAGATVATTSLVSHISATILATIEATISVVCKATI